MSAGTERDAQITASASTEGPRAGAGAESASLDVRQAERPAEALDVEAIRAKWLWQCGPCDAGLPMGCTHPDEDYRPVMKLLVDEVERLRSLQVTFVGETMSATVPMSGLDRLIAERDELRATVERVEAFIDQRPEYINALRNTPGNGDQADYHRWTRGAEARRQLATSLGWTVPHEFGEHTAALTPPAPEEAEKLACPTCGRGKEDRRPGPHAEGWGRCPESFHFGGDAR